MKLFLRKFLPKGIAVIILVTLYSLTRLPELSNNERIQLARQFHFAQTPLFEPSNLTPKYVRTVHPQYEKISAWISSVGAAVTLTDLDGNGLCNDIIHVDPRFDKIFISPADGTPSFYKAFELVTKTSFYDSSTTAPMGTLAYDFNNDGQTDILVYYWGRTPIIFYQDNGSFHEQELNPVKERWFTNAATLSDFDGDGQVDILITNYFPDGSRVLDGKATDELQTMQHSMSRAYNGGNDHFFLFSGMKEDKAFYTEHTEWRNDVDHPMDWTLAVGAADIDGDQLPEIYFANDFGPDKLLYNLSTPGHLHFKQLKGIRRFRDIRSGVLGKDSFKGMGISFGDINDDGLLDIYVGNIAAKYALEESHFVFINTGDFKKMKDGIAPFINESEKLGLSRSSWAWDSKLADFNNDGELEALQAVGFIRGTDDKWAQLQELAIGNDELLANPDVWPDFRPGTDLSGKSLNPFFVKSKSGRYFDISSDIGLDQSHISRGIAIGDVDHDGNLDMVIANQWEPSYFYRNNYKGPNKILGLRVMSATNSNMDFREIDPEESKGLHFAIGASIKVILPDGRIMPGFVEGGNGHSGKNSNEVFFGVGNISVEQKLKIVFQWRNARGIIQKKSIELKSGWHTIILPS